MFLFELSTFAEFVTRNVHTTSRFVCGLDCWERSSPYWFISCIAIRVFEIVKLLTAENGLPWGQLKFRDRFRWIWAKKSRSFLKKFSNSTLPESPRYLLIRDSKLQNFVLNSATYLVKFHLNFEIEYLSRIILTQIWIFVQYFSGRCPWYCFIIFFQIWSLFLLLVKLRVVLRLESRLNALLYLWHHHLSDEFKSDLLIK